MEALWEWSRFTVIPTAFLFTFCFFLEPTIHTIIYRNTAVNWNRSYTNKGIAISHIGYSEINMVKHFFLATPKIPSCPHPLVPTPRVLLDCYHNVPEGVRCNIVLSCKVWHYNNFLKYNISTIPVNKLRRQMSVWRQSNVSSTLNWRKTDICQSRLFTGM